MAITINDDGRNAMLDALADLFDGATMTIRTGAAPSASAIASGTVLATITLPTPAFAAAAGTVAKAGTWQDASADATGTAGHFRIVASGGAVIEGTCTATGDGGDLQLSTTSLISGTPFTVTAFTMSLANG